MAFAVTSAIWLWHVAGYFFLFDDYALVGGAANSPVRQLVATSMFGFYRPVQLLMLKAAAWPFAWSSPAGFALVSFGLHAATAALLFSLARLRGARCLAAAWGALLVFISPWAAEAVCWVSASSHLLATLFSLATLLAAHASSHAGTRRKRAAWAVGGMVMAACAFASNEMAVTLPALVLVNTTWVSPTGRRWALLPVALGASVALVAYLAVREALLPGLSGPYGGVETFSHLDPVNVASFAKALVVLPLPLGDPFDTMWVALVRLPVVGIVLPAMLWVSLRDAPARTLALLVSAGLSVLPVAWTVPAGRFCYLPGALCCLWGAHALELWCRRLDVGIRARTGPAVVLAFLAVYLSTSLGAQVRVWQQAAILARASVEQFVRVVDRGIEAVHIPNLPHYCAEGPFVMKAYAFGYYYAGHQVPSVRADATVPRCADAGYPIVDAFPDAYSTHAQPVPGELTLLLQSPVPVAANRPGHPDQLP